mgnify:FL=1
MEPEDVRSYLAELNPQALLADGFDRALVGVAGRCGMAALAVYDRDKCIEILMEEGMDWPEAEEYFCFNVEGAYLGEGTPLFAVLSTPDCYG